MDSLCEFDRNIRHSEQRSQRQRLRRYLSLAEFAAMIGFVLVGILALSYLGVQIPMEMSLAAVSP